MPRDFNNPEVMMFLKDLYEAESTARARWVYKHEESLKKAATLKREPTNYYESDVKKSKMMGGLTIITREHINAGNLRRKVPLRDAATMKCAKDMRHDHSIVKMNLGNAENDPRLARADTSNLFDPIMRPVDKKINKIIYKPRPEFGRKAYLDARYKEMPEKKFYFAECVNWDYGWRIGDSVLPFGSDYGRHWLLQRSLHSRTGPQPDPPYYKSADIPTASKCVPLET